MMQVMWEMINFVISIADRAVVTSAQLESETTSNASVGSITRFLELV